MARFILLVLACLTFGATLVEGGCGYGWHQYGSKCYKYFAKSLTWEQAQSHCNALNSDLVVINNKQENSFVRKLIVAKSAWIGMKKLSKDSYFSWVGVPNSCSSYEYFQSGQPNNYGGNQNCVEMLKSSSCWTDRECSTRLCHVCEKRQN
ncbi:asialoglycoprotein receptor 2-like [Antedon mediterranea]|uniref:asialoglycoprotein receptor 2-like n=1 Tax=Antedon mediterranea TaxID=105859 RepID=UPI003AF4C7BB